MAGLGGGVPGPSRMPKLPLLPPPRFQRPLDASWTPICGATTSAFLAGTPQPPRMQRAKEVRQGIAEERTSDGLRPPPKRRFLHRPTASVPPPPWEAFRSHEGVARHAYRWDPQTTMAAHFRPDNHTMMINGRPMQARGIDFQDRKIKCWFVQQSVLCSYCPAPLG